MASPFLALGSEAAFAGREMYWMSSSDGGEDIANAGVGDRWDEQRKRNAIATSARWSRRPTCEAMGATEPGNGK